MKDLRLIPLLIVAIAALLGLKGVGLLVGVPVAGGVTPARAQAPAAQPAEGQAPAGQAPEGQTPAQAADGADAPVPAGNAAGGGELAPVAPETTAETPATTPAETPGPAAQEQTLFDRMFGSGSPSRDDVLDSLVERREQLEARARELELRENLLKAAENRVEQRIAELQALEARLGGADEARKQADEERMKNLVAMYSEMKPKDAARIFNGLEMPILVRVADLMGARQMSAIMAEMASPAAQQLTIELSRESEDPINAVEQPGELPKIMGTRAGG